MDCNGTNVHCTLSVYYELVHRLLVTTDLIKYIFAIYLLYEHELYTKNSGITRYLSGCTRDAVLKCTWLG